MQPFITRIKTNLNGVLQMTQMIDGIMMTGDDLANQIIVELHRDRVPVVIPEETKIVGYFIRPDGYTLEIDGSAISENEAMVTIPALAYQIPGALSIAIRMFTGPHQEEQRGYYDSETTEFVIVTDPSVTEGPHGEPVFIRTYTAYDNKIVIAAASCFVQITETDSVIEPGHEIPDINDVIQKLAELDHSESLRRQAEGLRVIAEESRVDAETLRATAETLRIEAENTRITAEQGRVSAENSRASEEITRETNEAAREAAESARAAAETARIAAESARDTAEQARAAAETARDTSETARISAETARDAAETIRETNENVRETNEAARQYAIQNMSVTAVGLAPYSEPTATIVDVDGHKHITFGLTPGNPFVIVKAFASVAEMEAYSGTDVKVYDFVIIESNVQDPDNAKLYMKEENSWFYVTDLSGSQGIQGPQGIQGETGNGIATAVLNADYTLTITYTDGTSYTTGSIRGATGNGIASTVLNPNYTLTITYTDGNTATLGPIRGATGNGIESVVLNPDYTLTINYTDGESVTTSSIRGETGPIGPGIDHVQVNSDYTLTIYLENGTSYTTPFSMRGPKGEPGWGGADLEYDSVNKELTITFGSQD